MKKMKPTTMILILVAVFLVGSVLWSVIFETLLPLYRDGDTAAFIANLIGIPIILAGTVVIVYGGLRVVRGMFGFMTVAAVEADMQTEQDSIAKSKGRGGSQRAGSFRYWLMAWVPGGPLMLLGFLLIGIGSFIINRF